MNFKVKCVNVKSFPDYFTEGKIYEVIDGEITSETGYTFASWSDSEVESNRCSNFECLKKWFNPWYTFELVEDKKMFTKSDLKNGDVVVRRNGWVEVVIVDLDVMVSKNGWDSLSDIKEDLTDEESDAFDNEYDIVKVYRPIEKYACTFNNYTKGKLMYDRERDTKPKYNGKVVCIDLNDCNQSYYTVGKIYQFKDGVITCDNNFKVTHFDDSPFTSFEDFARLSGSKFIEIKE